MCVHKFQHVIYYPYYTSVKTHADESIAYRQIAIKSDWNCLRLKERLGAFGLVWGVFCADFQPLSNSEHYQHFYWCDPSFKFCLNCLDCMCWIYELKEFGGSVV